MRNALPSWLIGAIVSAVYILPGALAGGLLGWFIIRPVNAVLGFLFGGFNRWFDWMTALYGRGVGRTLRLSVMVLVIYAGLLGLTYWQFQRTPTGFIPQQDKGYLLLNVQLPDSASVERTAAARWPTSNDLAHDMPGVAAHGRPFRPVVDLERQRAQPGLDVHPARSRSTNGTTRSLSADAIAKALQERCHDEGAGGDRLGLRRAARSTAWARPAASS